MEGSKNILLSASRFQFIAIGPAKFLKIGQRIMFFMAKMNFELAGEIIHDHEFSFFFAILLT